MKLVYSVDTMEGLDRRIKKLTSDLHEAIQLKKRLKMSGGIQEAEIESDDSDEELRLPRVRGKPSFEEIHTKATAWTASKFTKHPRRRGFSLREMQTLREQISVLPDEYVVPLAAIAEQPSKLEVEQLTLDKLYRLHLYVKAVNYMRRERQKPGRKPKSSLII